MQAAHQAPDVAALGHLQRLITERTTLPKEYQRLIFNGKELKDASQTVLDMGMSKENCTLFLIVRVLGGS